MTAGVAGGLRLGLLACALAVLPSCSAALSFDQCTTDEDCLRYAVDGAKAFCTADQICVSDYPDDRICALDVVSSSRADAVTLAGLFRLTGPNEVEDTDIARAVELAVDEINLADKRAFRLVLCDTGGDPEQARKALARAVLGYGAFAVIGPSTSSELVALARDGDNLVTKYDVLVVSSSATAPAITALADDGLVWRTAGSDILQTRVLANLVPPDTTRVASAYVSSTYGSGLNGAFSNALGQSFSPPLIPVAKAFPEGAPGADVVGFLAASTPEVALIVADSDAPVWVAALADGGAALASTQFLLTDSAKSQSLLSLNPPQAVLDRITGTAPATPSGLAFNAFKSVYEGTYGVDPSSTAFVANAYDATYAIAIALGSIPPEFSISGRFLAEAMRRLSDARPEALIVRVGPSDFAAAYQELANEGVVNLEGTSGPIDFDPNTGDVVSVPIEVWKIDRTMNPPFVTQRIEQP